MDANDAGRTGMHGPTPILYGPDNRPLPPRKAVQEEVATPELIGARSFWDGTVASGLSPERLARILRDTVRGDIRDYITLAEEMEERDLHYAAVLGVRKRALAKVRPTVGEDAGKTSDARIVEAVKELIGEPIMTGLIEDLTDAYGKSFAAAEIGWAERDGLWKPVNYVWRDQRYFTFDHISRTTLRLADHGTIDGLELPPAKFVVHYPNLKAGIPIRGGLSRIAVWAFMLKSFSLKDWMTFLDVYGMPVRVGKYHPNATPEERRKLLQAVGRIASDAHAIIPESMVIEFIEAKSSGSPNYENLCRYLDEQLSKLVLGQTMTSDNGSSQSQAEVHNQIRLEIVEFDARQMAATLNRDLISWFVRFNWGDGARAPLVDFPIREPTNLKEFADAVGSLVDRGLEVAQDDVREKVGLPAPKEGAKILSKTAAPAQDQAAVDPAGRQAASPSGAKPARAVNAAHEDCGCGHCRELSLRRALNAAAETAIGDTDELADAELDGWQEIMDPVVAQLLAIADEAGTLAGALTAADTASLDLTGLVDRLATVTAIARGLGDVRD